MRAIIDNVITFYEMRAKALSILVANTQKALEEFTLDRERIANEQADKLENFIKDLIRDINDMITRFWFQKEYKQLSEEQERSLIDFVNFVKALNKDLSSLLNRFQAVRDEMKKELQDEFTREIKEIGSSAKRRLKEFDDVLSGRSSTLRKRLSKYAGSIAGSVGNVKYIQKVYANAKAEQENQNDLTFITEELHRLFDTIPEVPYSAPPLERPEIICFARRIEVLTGYGADQILAGKQLWINMIHPADQERVFAAFTRCKNQGAPFEIEYRIIHKDGSVHHVIDEGEPVFDDKGQIIRIEGIITDITEYKKARICVCEKNPEVKKCNNVNSSIFQKV